MMCVAAVWRWLFLAAIVSSLVAASPPLRAADPQQEIAARALLGEAEKLIELASLQDAMTILGKVKSDYRGTEAAVFSELRRAQCLMFLHRYDEAIAAGRSVVAANPGQIVACWAQSVVGQSLIFAGAVAEGLRELMKVKAMLPGTRDLGPLEEAREVIGRECEKYLAGRSDDLDAAEYLGLRRSNAADTARTLAILAAYRARYSTYDAAKAVLARMASECASEETELRWATAEAMLLCLDKTGLPTAQAAEAADALASSCSSLPAGHHLGAAAHLALARYYGRVGDQARVVATLQEALDRYGAAANRAEILYELGNALVAQGNSVAAASVLERVAQEHPVSGYAAPALYCAGTCSKSDRSTAMRALTKLAEGNYEQQWRGLAYYRLGALYRAEDKAKARTCYTKAVETLERCAAEGVADLQSNWRELLAKRVAAIRSELAALPSDEGAER